MDDLLSIIEQRIEDTETEHLRMMHPFLRRWHEDVKPWIRYKIGATPRVKEAPYVFLDRDLYVNLVTETMKRRNIVPANEDYLPVECDFGYFIATRGRHPEALMPLTVHLRDGYWAGFAVCLPVKNVEMPRKGMRKTATPAIFETPTQKEPVRAYETVASR
jgi:hypothetical protein